MQFRIHDMYQMFVTEFCHVRISQYETSKRCSYRCRPYFEYRAIRRHPVGKAPSHPAAVPPRSSALLDLTEHSPSVEARIDTECTATMYCVVAVNDTELHRL